MMTLMSINAFVFYACMVWGGELNDLIVVQYPQDCLYDRKHWEEEAGFRCILPCPPPVPEWRFLPEKLSYYKLDQSCLRSGRSRRNTPNPCRGFGEDKLHWTLPQTPFTVFIPVFRQSRLSVFQQRPATPIHANPPHIWPVCHNLAVTPALTESVSITL